MSAETGRKNLRQGFTTGTAAAAAARAALLGLMGQKVPERIPVDLPGGGVLGVALDTVCLENGAGVATVVKDAGDDPDVTHKARIGARVTRIPGTGILAVTGGRGVGTVTRPGLEVPPGRPAINPGPMAMIRLALSRTLGNEQGLWDVTCEIFVENGEALAMKTLNARLGILGGISILGTTGLVKPLSHQAYMATIDASMSVARACGVDTAVLTTGRRSERLAQGLFPDLPEQAFIQIGDFFQKSMAAAAGHGFTGVVLAVFFGKALKMAQGFAHTHAASSVLTMDWLRNLNPRATGDGALARAVRGANTARHAMEMILPGHPELVARVGRAAGGAASGFWNRKPGPGVRVIVFDVNGCPAFDSGPCGIGRHGLGGPVLKGGTRD